MRLLVGVIASKLPEFQRLICDGQRTTWANHALRPPDTHVLFYYGESPSTTVRDDEIYFPLPEGYDYIICKTMAFFEHALKHIPFDYLLRTNCSSYVDLAGLKKHLSDKPRSKYFSAVIGHENGRPFASGAGYVLTPDLVELAVKHRQKVDFPHCPDDVILSNLLQDLGATIIPARRQDFQTLSQVSQIDRSIYHFRCKAYEGGRRVDDRLMRRVHELLHAY
jgi:hypothetical protein